MSHLSQLHFAYGKPSSNAVIRSAPEDFKVNEQLSFKPADEGQHALLCVQKRSYNTSDVAKLLANFAGVKPVAIGYAGLKDKHALTTQWFSVDLAGKPEPLWNDMESEGLKIIAATRHSRKLKRGAISSNQFELILRQIAGDRDDINQRLEKIKAHGVPNYFGEQRFGNNDYNLVQAEKLLLKNKKVKRHLRSIYLSAVRSFLFNQVLSQRVAQQSWNKPMQGDVFMLSGSQSIFSPEQIDQEILGRVESADIHPTGPLYGAGELTTRLEVLEFEKKILSEFPRWCALLEKFGMKQERRSLRIVISDFNWDWQANELKLKFSLPSGCYATSVLRELVTCKTG